MQEYAKFAHTLADESGKIIRKYYRKQFDIESKNDLSPVTIADKETEERLRALIQQQYPTHGIIGEEFGNHQIDAEYSWIIDPIDGTSSFIAGRPTFTTLISLAKNGVPIIGIIDQPISGERWVGISGGGVTLNGQKIKVRNTSSLQDATLCTTAPHYFNEKSLKMFNAISEKAKTTLYGGDSYNYALLASGYVDVIIEYGLQCYDYCALVPVIQEAGGIITDWQGKDLTLSSGKANIVAHVPSIKILDSTMDI